MELSEEMLEQIEQLASIYMPIRDIALIIEVDETALRVGSPLALENARQNLLDMEDDE